MNFQNFHNQEITSDTVIEKIEGIVSGQFAHIQAIFVIKKTKEKYKNVFVKVNEKILRMTAQFNLIIEMIEMHKNDRDYAKTAKFNEILEKIELVKTDEFRPIINLFTINYSLDFFIEEVLEALIKTLVKNKEDEQLRLLKITMTFWRKLDIFSTYFNQALFADASEITNISPNCPEWKEFMKIMHFYKAGNSEIIEKFYIENFKFLGAIQISLAKCSGALPNFKKLTANDIELMMTPKFMDYESFMENIKNAGKEKKEEIWKKKFLPNLNSKTWKNVFWYMMNPNELKIDLDFFIAFCDKKCILDFWNVSETFFAKASHKFSIEKIGFRKSIFLSPSLLQANFEQVKDYPYCKQCKDRGSTDSGGIIDIPDKELLPDDFLTDNPNEEKLGIKILAPSRFGFTSAVQSYRDTKGMENLKKEVKIEIKMGSRKNIGEMESEEKVEDKKNDEQKDISGVKSEDKNENKKGWGWVKSKMFKLTSIFKNEGNPKNQILNQNQSNTPTENVNSIGNGKEKEVFEIEEEKVKELGSDKLHNLNQIKNEMNEKNELNESLDKIKQLKANFEKEQDAFPSPSPTPNSNNNSASKQLGGSGVGLKYFFSSSASKYPTEGKELFKKIIIHTHGGGYIGMTSNYHEFYLRGFSNGTKRPVFSIDYRLAPMVKYPGNLEDCIKGYFWILNYIEKVIGTEVEDIILIGDSAGGALATSLTYWLIENKKRKPDLLLLAYSSLSLKVQGHNGSQLRSANDPLLHYSALRACHDFYLPENAKSEEDYYISQIMAPQELLRQMPKTRLFVSMEDPLQDDQYKLARKLQQAEVDVEVHNFRLLQHGVLTEPEKDMPAAQIFRNMIIAVMNQQFNSK